LSTPGFERGPHWWEASAVTTAPLTSAVPPLPPLFSYLTTILVGALLMTTLAFPQNSYCWLHVCKATPQIFFPKTGVAGAGLKYWPSLAILN